MCRCTVTRETGFGKRKRASKRRWTSSPLPAIWGGLVFPSWVLSNTLRYYHHFPLSTSSADTPQRAALSCTSAFATLPWKHSHGIAHYRNRHLHIISEKLSRGVWCVWWGGWRLYSCVLLKLWIWMLRSLPVRTRLWGAFWERFFCFGATFKRDLEWKNKKLPQLCWIMTVYSQPKM